MKQPEQLFKVARQGTAELPTEYELIVEEYEGFRYYYKDVTLRDDMFHPEHVSMRFSYDITSLPEHMKMFTDEQMKGVDSLLSDILVHLLLQANNARTDDYCEPTNE